MGRCEIYSIFIMAIIFLPIFIGARVLIFTYSYNRPDFIEIQYKTFKKFLKDEYEFIVFNDACDEPIEHAINHLCQRYNIRCVRIPQEIHDRPYLQRWPGESYHHPAVRNCNVVQYSLDTIGFNHDDIVALFDSDLFLVKDFSIKEFMRSFDIAGVAQSRPNVDYLWIGLVFLDMKSLPNKSTINFNCGKIGDIPVDAGGHTHYYLKNNNVRCNYMNHQLFDNYRCEICNIHNKKCFHNTDHLISMGFKQSFIDLIQSGVNMEHFVDDHFLHYRAGTNWDYQSVNFHENKTKELLNFLEKIL